jgi:hypothetical protein
LCKESLPRAHGSDAIASPWARRAGRHSGSVRLAKQQDLQHQADAGSGVGLAGWKIAALLARRSALSLNAAIKAGVS